MTHPLPRPVTLADVEILAGLHVLAWAETYVGLLPASEIARRDLDTRRAQWRTQIGADISRIALIPGAGFAQAGPQRDLDLLAQGYPDELYALYCLRAAHGTGAAQALLRAVFPVPAQAFTALVLADNSRARAFYGKTGGRVLETRADLIGETPISETVYGWAPPHLF